MRVRQSLERLIAFVVLLLHAGCTANSDSNTTSNHFGLVTLDFNRSSALMFTPESASPLEARSKLLSLSNAIRSVVAGWDDTQFMKIAISPGGRSVALLKEPTWMLGTWSGVWVWTDWRDPSSVLPFLEYKNLRFLSDEYIVLDDGASGLVFNTSTGQSWNVRDVKSVDIRAIRSDGTWFGTNGSHELMAGRLADSGPVVKAVVPEVRNVMDVFCARDEKIIIVEMTNETISSYDSETLVPLDSTKVRESKVRSNAGIFGRVGDQYSLVAIGADGHFSIFPKRWLGGFGDERPFKISPDGALVLTYVDGIFGAVYVNVRNAETGRKAFNLRGGFPVGWLTIDKGSEPQNDDQERDDPH